MARLTWSIAHAVFVTEIDDEHKEIFAAVANFQRILTNSAALAQIKELTQPLIASAHGHFAHEERLMRASRYEAFAWHKRQHDTARKRMRQYVARLKRGDASAGPALIDYLTSWLHDHTRLADRMMAAFLRNLHLCKVTIRAGGKPTNQVDV